MPDEKIQQIYDPFLDPTAMEMDEWSGFGAKGLKPEDLSASPAVIQILIGNQRMALARLGKAEATVERLRSQNEDLRNAKENLRVNLASARERGSALLVEIPASLMGGIGINLLTSESGSHTLGWLLIGSAALILLGLRSRDVKALFRKKPTPKAEEMRDG